MTFTTQYSTATGHTTANDSNANATTGKSDAINLTATDLTIDAGMIGNLALGDFVWNDPMPTASRMPENPAFPASPSTAC